MGKYPVKFNLSHISLDVHKHIFTDIIQSIRGALVDLGYECSVMENAFDGSAINIAIGSTIFLHRHRELFDSLKSRPFILYQLEQLDPQYGLTQNIPEYTELMQAATHIWEYSHVGLNYLRRGQLGEKTSFLPPSFHRSLEKFRPREDPDIDVFFYGSVSDRRAHVLETLRAEGVRAVNSFGVYGSELDEYIRRAKIILNLHMWDGLSVLETVRLSYLLANRSFVVSEHGDHNPYEDGVAFADYDNLVETCKLYLGERADQRDAIATKGYLAFRRSDMVSDLRRAIDELPMERFAPTDPSRQT